MALVQNDSVIRIPLPQLLSIGPFKYGVVITAGASPVIAWEAEATITYSALAAPAGVFKAAAPLSAANITNFLLKKVAPIAGGINPNGSGVGVVVNVLSISGLGADAFSDQLIVRNVQNVYQIAPPAAWLVLPNQ